MENSKVLMDSARVGLAIPTLNGGRRWAECLEAIAKQTYTPRRRLVIDSASSDGTVTLAIKAGIEVERIARSDFSHGGTRQLAVEYLADCEIIVFLTQDAVLATPDSLSELLQCFKDPDVAIAYGRQLPRSNANAMEAHARGFNYGELTQRKGLPSIGQYEAKTFFCSNSFAAYRRSVLVDLGGFRRDLIIGEDAEFAARAVLAGYTNVYCASATVFHSHDYGMAEVFRRYFDTGVFHARNAWMHERFGSHGAEGIRFVKSEIRYLSVHEPLMIPRALCHSLAKFVGYRLGRYERILPRRLKAILSMTPGYWRRG